MRPLAAEFIFIDLLRSKGRDWHVVATSSTGTIEPLLVSAVDSKVNNTQLTKQQLP